jgi:hypothetical protein
MSKWHWLVLIGIAAIGAAFVTGILVGRSRGIPFVETISTEWAIGVYEGTSPFELEPAPDVVNPVLAAESVTDVKARFVADPFIVAHEGKYYMFFEVLNAATGQGDIGVAVSEDGVRWRYQQIVLDEPFHLSYPLVFHYDGQWFMVPESWQAKGVRLYKAVEFPHKWSCVKTLVRGPYRDSTVFRYQGYWWMFTCYGGGHDILRLFYAKDLTGVWVEHPKSPVVEGDANIARPAGRVLFYNGRIYRIAQDCEPVYGSAVLAFEITRLTTRDYEEKPVAQNPLLQAGGTGWNAHGMHQLDVIRKADGRWLAVVDGKGEKRVYGIRY